MASESISEGIKKAVQGDAEAAVIKAGTLAVTRGTGAILGALMAGYAVMQVSGFDPWETLTPLQKLLLALAAVLLWVMQSGADAIARGIATTKPEFVELPAGLAVTKTEGKDQTGWAAVALRVSSGGDAALTKWLIVKAGKTEWVSASDLEFN